MGRLQRRATRAFAYHLSHHRLSRVSPFLGLRKSASRADLLAPLQLAVPRYRVAPRLNQMIKDVFVPFLSGKEYDGQALEAPKPIDW